LRTKEFLYVRNYEPNRWPAWNPETGFTNGDCLPTKSLILEQQKSRNDWYYDLSFGKRLAEELFDMREDTVCTHNLADEAEHPEIEQK
jgi:N-sulfoglucosamine sulfohydrolase